MKRKYYQAYEDRYKQIHTSTGRAWAGEEHSPTIEKLLKKYGAHEKSKILELGCGEGQNALYLLQNNFNVEATDVSPEAIKWCKGKARDLGIDEGHFHVLDALNNNLKDRYDFIYAVAVLHMLVKQNDRDQFLRFISEHLNENGKAFIVVMGDGKETRKTDVTKAFELIDRPFEGQLVKVATTSCRMVTWEEFFEELDRAKLHVLNHFNDKTIAGFVECMVVELERK